MRDGKDTVTALPDDRHHLSYAQSIRRRMTKPKQSHFRVVCVLVLQDGSRIVGLNDEPTPNIGGSICAERSALLRLTTEDTLRMLYDTSSTSCPTQRRIQCVYLVTDSDKPISPGMLCREFMYGHAACHADLRICVQSCNESSKPWITRLSELYPYPSLYARRSVDEQRALGQSLGEKLHHHSLLDTLAQMNKTVSLYRQELEHAISLARHATIHDDFDALHPIRYGAAAAVLDGSTVQYATACQRKILEYGSTLDAVTQLATQLFAAAKSQSTVEQPHVAKKVLFLVMSDQYGVLHPPFASGRSFLVEYGFGDALCVFHTQEGTECKAVPSDVLAPFVPNFR